MLRDLNVAKLEQLQCWKKLMLGDNVIPED
jgi:hypothetical protein